MDKEDTHAGRHDKRDRGPSRSVSYKSDHSRNSCRRQDRAAHASVRAGMRTLAASNTANAFEAPLPARKNTERFGGGRLESGAVLSFAAHEVEADNKQQIEHVLGVLLKGHNIGFRVERSRLNPGEYDVDCDGRVEVDVWKALWRLMPNIIFLCNHGWGAGRSSGLFLRRP